MINAIVDDGSERMGAKIRNAQIKKIPYMFIVGDQEMESNTVAVRTRNGDDLGQIKREDILATLIQLKQTRTIELIANTSEKQ
jgi:threonyl-tRNA synthetase